jgi:protein transport protein SEC61 subunit gamma-like protein
MDHEQPQQQTQEQKEQKPTLIFKLKRFANECWRVLQVTKKPTRDEFKTIVKVSGIGILIIGLIGFISQMIKQIFFS